MLYRVTHKSVVETVSEYLVESDDEFYPEDLAVDAVIDFQICKKLDNGVKVTLVQFDQNVHDEIFEVDEVESDD